MRHFSKIRVSLLAALGSFVSQNAAADTQVTTYVVKVQEEREQTRWTLTEWLRIKERMKMMDVWLAMFSDPKTSKFQPELMLSYGMTRGTMRYQRSGGAATEGTLGGAVGKGQLWLTNLISSTIGVRTLNVDLGIEGFRRQTDNISPSVAAANTDQESEGTSSGRLDTSYYTGDLRIFGRSIQDSSLVLKYGRYTSRNSVFDTLAAAEKSSVRGSVAGAELQLYILRALGIEGSYLHFGDSAGARGTKDQAGSYYEALGFIEISLIRLMAGIYREDWSISRQGEDLNSTERGTFAGMKLQL